MTEWITDSMH